MAIRGFFTNTSRSLTVAAALVAASALATVPTPARAIDTGAAVGIGLGSFALGTAVGSAAAQPYGYAPYGYAAPPAPAYYAPAPGYYPPARNCWDRTTGATTPAEWHPGGKASAEPGTPGSLALALKMLPAHE